jgi:hypothetical protein
MARSEENRGFECIVCRRRVKPLTNGSYRNHCPFCLASVHLDIIPGDRRSACSGVMDAIALRHSKKGWQILHRCQRCGIEKLNRVAGDPNQPDDIEALIRLVSEDAR